MEIYPSLISSNLLTIQETLHTLDPHCNGYHLDIMDNHFVPNLTWGPMFVNAIREATHLPLHIHAMVSEPIKLLSMLNLQASDTFIFHYESIDPTQHRTIIDALRKRSWKVGVAIKPITSIEYLFDILSYLDMVLLMSVKPGFSGQNFIPETTKKIAPLIHMKQQNAYKFMIGMDGGVCMSNIASLASFNVDSVAVAHAIFHQKNPVVALKELYSCSLR